MIFAANETMLRAAMAAFEALCTTCGLVLSSKAKAIQNTIPTEEMPQGKPIRVLGVTLTPNYEKNVLKMEVQDGKLENLEKLIETAKEELLQRKCKVKTFQKLCGLAQFVITCGENNSGASLLHPLYPMTVKAETKQQHLDFLNEVNSEEKRKLKLIILEYLRINMQKREPRIFDVNKKLNYVTVLWTDASSNGGVGEMPAIAAVLVDHTGKWHFTSGTVKMKDDDECRRIAVTEMLAVISAAESFGEILKGK